MPRPISFKGRRYVLDMKEAGIKLITRSRVKLCYMDRRMPRNRGRIQEFSGDGGGALWVPFPFLPRLALRHGLLLVAIINYWNGRKDSPINLRLHNFSTFRHDKKLTNKISEVYSGGASAPWARPCRSHLPTRKITGRGNQFSIPHNEAMGISTQICAEMSVRTRL